MKNKIEEGCLAIIQHSIAGNNGKCVTVGKFLGKIKGWKWDTRWEVDPPINSASLDTVTGRITNLRYGDCRHISEHALLRIDNYQPEKETCQVEELTHD